jgi:hypothetical protein
MILETILLGSGAVVMNQVGSELAKNLVPELLGGAIERSMDGLLNRIRPEHNQDFMHSIAAALKRATDNLLVGSKIVYDPDRKICQDLVRDAEKLFVQKFGEPQKAVRDALLVGTVEDVSKALERLVAPYFVNGKARAPHELKPMLALAFIHAFWQIIKDEKHEQGWKAFHHDLAWAMHQQLIALNKGQEKILVNLKAMHEGNIEFPDIAQEFDKQTEKMVTILCHTIIEDGDKTRQKLEDLAADMKQKGSTQSLRREVVRIGIEQNTRRTYFYVPGVDPDNRLPEGSDSYPVFQLQFDITAQDVTVHEVTAYVYHYENQEWLKIYDPERVHVGTRLLPRTDKYISEF